MNNSYLPLYRKYRPQKFDDVVGQESIIKTLSNAIQLNKISHAYLFNGPRGTGKTSTARIFAKSLNCSNGPTLVPCGTCSNCTDITGGNSIDVIEIDAASNRKVEDTRNLLEKVQFVPASGKYKIYIIDEVHMLTTEAFNTLLKTLEEPPANLIFILATTEAHKVLDTIISRCQRFDFRRIKQSLIIQNLKKIIQIENLNINEKALSIIARRCYGGMRDALSLTEQASVLSSMGHEVTEKDILTLLGSMSEDSLLAITDAITQKDSSSLLKKLDEIVQLGNDPLQLIRELISYFRNLMLIKTSNSKESIESILDISEQFYPQLEKQAGNFEVTEITQIIQKLFEYEKMLKSASNQQLWLEVALINICYREDIQAIQNLEKRIASLESAISSGNINLNQENQTSFSLPENNPPSSPQKVNSPPEKSMKQETSISSQKTQEEKITSKKPESTDKIAQKSSSSLGVQSTTKTWKALLENIDSLPSRMFFSNLAKPVEINENKVVITFAGESFVKQAQSKTKLDPLEKAAYKLFNKNPKFMIRTPMPEDEKVKENSGGDANSDKTPEKKQQSPKNNISTKETIHPKSTPQDNIKENSDSTPTKENYTNQNNETTLYKNKNTEIIMSADSAEPLDEDVVKQLNSINYARKNTDLSDQARTVLELFNGKIID